MSEKSRNPSFFIAERRRTCELTAELFAITYPRNKSVQISLRFVYRRVVPWNDKFRRKSGLILYFTESYFDRIARISAHLKVFRKIPPLMFWFFASRRREQNRAGPSSQKSECSHKFHIHEAIKTQLEESIERTEQRNINRIYICNCEHCIVSDFHSST